jgi:hypothetical protein
MNESTAQANGQAPVERLVAVEDIRRIVAREVADQLSAPPPAPTIWQRVTHALFIGSSVSLIILAILTVVRSLP